MIIADENIEQYWIELLRATGYEVLSIREQHAGMDDVAIATLAKSRSGLLITEDKDFGELVFAHGIRGLSVVFLRYEQPFYEQIEAQLLAIINRYEHATEHFFITITEHKIRVRRI